MVLDCSRGPGADRARPAMGRNKEMRKAYLVLMPLTFGALLVLFLVLAAKQS